MASVVLHASAALAVSFAPHGAEHRSESVIKVVLLERAPHVGTAPGMSPPPSRPPVRTRPPRRAVGVPAEPSVTPAPPAQIPRESPPDEDALESAEAPPHDDASEGARPDGGWNGGGEDGVADGTAERGPPDGLIAPAPPPPPARPADLAAVRSAVAKALEYPAIARRMRLQGRVILVFTLRADGTVADLHLGQSSGVAMLDGAALEGVRRASPFPRPDVERRLTLPVTFRLET